MRNMQTHADPPRNYEARVRPWLRLLQPKSCALPALVCILLLISDACAGLQQVFPQPVLHNPSFEDYCTNGTGFFFAPDPSEYADSGLKNISSSTAVALMKWNISGLGLEVVSYTLHGSSHPSLVHNIHECGLLCHYGARPCSLSTQVVLDSFPL